MILTAAGWGKSRSHELPVRRIKTVIIQRKSVIPFATFTILAAITALIAEYNVLWFLLDLSTEGRVVLSLVALFGSMVCLVGTFCRALFVNIAVSWDGRPRSFLVRFVSGRHGKRLASRFQRISTEM